MPTARKISPRSLQEGGDGAPASRHGATRIHVCTSCLHESAAPAGAETAGQALFNALRRAAFEEPAIRIAGVDCLAVCDRPVAIAYQTAQKWSYVIADVDPAADVTDVIKTARAIVSAQHGIPAMKDRPPFFKRGVICRLPPLVPSRSKG